MRLVIVRREYDTFTAGRLFINGIQQCFTLEDRVREIPGKPVDQWKVPGDTAIPYGRYEVYLTESHRFKRVLPLIAGVEGFSGIRVHAGNKVSDTEGCVLVGTALDESSDTPLKNSRVALEELVGFLSKAKDKIILTIG